MGVVRFGRDFGRSAWPDRGQPLLVRENEEIYYEFVDEVKWMKKSIGER